MAAITTTDTIRAAQAIGITTSAFLAGTITSISVLSVPSLLLAPSPVAAEQWAALYDRGKKYAPSLAVFGSLFHALAAYQAYNHPFAVAHPSAWKLYAVAAVATVAIAPYTLLVMAPTNDSLHQKEQELKGQGLAEDVKEGALGLGGESTKALLDRWGTLNLIRGVFPLVGAAAAVWATLP
ncbi:MAG: hypothetical protein M1819_004049 [Sarea resinae]|nr:MAG: hypothetical protein M1819_004049 [Sarea resinae]